MSAKKVQLPVEIHRGDIFLADLGRTTGAERGGRRVVVIVENESTIGVTPTVIVAVLTKNSTAKKPSNVQFQAGKQNADITVLLDQLRTIDKRRLVKKVGRFFGYINSQIDGALLFTLGIDEGGYLNG